MANKDLDNYPTSSAATSYGDIITIDIADGTFNGFKEYPEWRDVAKREKKQKSIERKCDKLRWMKQ